MTPGSCAASRRLALARRLCISSLISVLLLVLAPWGRADEGGTVAQRAERWFESGRAAMLEGRFEAACEAFAQSQSLDPAAGTLVNWAVCLEARGQTASALTAYFAALASVRSQADPERELFIRQRITVLEPRVCRVTIAVPTDAP